MKGIKHILPLMALCVYACGQRGADGTHAEGQSDNFVSSAKVETYVYSPVVKPSTSFSVVVNGEDQMVLPTAEPHFCVFGCDGPVKVEIRSYTAKITSATVRPLSKNIRYKVEDDAVVLMMDTYDRVDVEINGDETHPLFLFANPLEASQKPSPSDSDVIFFEAGKVHEAGAVNLSSGKKIYIEGGAIVKGTVSGVSVDNVALEGCGVLDCYPSENKAVFFNKCNGISLKNITVLNVTSWTTFIAQSRNIVADGYKVIATFSAKPDGSGNENDAFDLLGCSHAEVKHGFSYCHDDAFCVKTQKWTYASPSSDLHFTDCIAWNVKSGNSFEVGYELNQDVSDVTFTDIYSIHSAGASSPLRRGAVGIHNAAGGKVSGLKYENVFIEDPKEFGIYISIMESSYNIGNDVTWTPGSMKDITFRNVHILKTPPKGNLVKGYDVSEHSIKVSFEDLYIGDKKVTDKTSGRFATECSTLVFN